MPETTTQDRADIVLRRLSQLKGERSSFESTWQDIADYVCPRKADISTTQSPGAIRTDILSDVTAIHANEVLGAGQLSYVCPANERWFKIQPADAKDSETSAVSDWFEQATQTLFNELASSNFYLEIHEHFIDRGSMGTACIYLQESTDGRMGSTLNFKNIPVGTFYIEEDCDGIVDTVYREFKWTARQAAQKFGEKALHEEMRKALSETDAGKANVQWDFIHAVEPRTGRNKRKVDAKNKAFASYWIDVKNKHVVSEGGYEEMPHFVSRFLKTKADKYGYSPAWSALPLIKQLNKIEDDLDALGEKAAFPPILAPFEAGFTLDSRPSGITYYDATKGDLAIPREWQTQGRYDIGLDRAEKKREQIGRMFFNDLFQMLSSIDKPMTAREVAERAAEKLVQFSPTFARMITELFTPLLRRAFALCLRRGLFGEPPSNINGIKIDYVSKIAMAIKALETRSFVQFIEILAPAAQIAPDIFDNIDFDKATRGLANNLSVPATWMRSEDDVKQTRDARNKMIEAQQAAEIGKTGAEAISKLPPGAQNRIVGA